MHLSTSVASVKKKGGGYSKHAALRMKCKHRVSRLILGLGHRRSRRHGGVLGQSPARTAPAELHPEAFCLARLRVLEKRLHLSIFPTTGCIHYCLLWVGVIGAKMKFYSTSKFYGNFTFQTIKF